MITNDRQYKITQAEIRRFEQALEAAGNAESDDIHPLIQQAMRDGMESQLAELREEVRLYEELREGRVQVRVFTRLDELPQALIEARIARRLSQGALAARLGLHEQQIQRYEQNGYRGVSIERVQEIADTLGISFEERVEYNLGDDMPESEPPPTVGA